MLSSLWQSNTEPSVVLLNLPGLHYQLTNGLLYQRQWMALGFILVMTVVYLSLADIHMPQMPSTIGDKVNHLVAYGVLAGWFGQLYLSHRQRVVVAVCLMLLGILMEVLQGVTVYRYFDWFDALANCLGVMLGMLMLYLGADKILKWFEVSILKAS